MQKRRSFFKKAIGLTGALSLLSFPSFPSQKKKKIEGRFVHMVFFWLKESVNADEFIQATESFVKQVKVARTYHLGKPAMTPRDVVDNTYSVSLVVTFDSKEDQDAYQVHPVHKKYVEDNNNKWTKVQIYDSWGQG